MKRIRMVHLYGIWDAFHEWIWNMGAKHCRHSLVLMYHELTYDSGIKETSCLHQVGTFQKTITRLQQEGYTFVSLDKATHIPPKGEKFATITFDDVHKSVFDYAYPFLKDRNIPFSIFVSPRFVGQENMLSLEELKALSADSLCLVGAHTMTHPMLRKTKDSFEEVVESKKWLENVIGKRIDYFAYPYGKHSSVSYHNIQQVKKAGFKAAFGTIDAPITSITQRYRFYLPRMVFHV